MKLPVAFVVLSLCLISNFAHAMNWRNCVKVTSVQDYRAYEASVYIGMSPTPPGCESLGRVRFTLNQFGVTADALKGFLALGTAAYLTNKSIQIYYDDTTPPLCVGQIVALNGYDGKCQ